MTLMHFFGSPLAHSLLHALGWTLLHFCWQGTIVAVVLWCVLQLLVGRSSQARYAATCIAFLLLVALPPITFSHLAAASLQSGRVTGNLSIAIDPAMLLQVNVGSTPAPWPARMAAALDHRMPWLLALWLAGAIFFVARLNYGLLVASRLKSAATEAPATGTLQMFEALRHRLGINRAVRLLHSARIQVPTVIGWMRPVVLIPASFLTGLSTLQIEAIFYHELAHVRRHDYLTSVFQSVAEALLFYHPAVWWISRQVRRERECCCDEIAVSFGGDVLEYARALSALEERRRLYQEVALGMNGGVLTMRIKRLLGYQETSTAAQLASITLLTVLILATAAGIGRLTYAQGSYTDAAGQSTQMPVTKTEKAPVVTPHDISKQVQNFNQQIVQLNTLRSELQGQVQESAGKGIDKANIWNDQQQKELDAAIQRLQSGMDQLNSEDFHKQLKEATETASRINTQQIQKQMDEARKSMLDASHLSRELADRLDTPEFKKQIEDATRGVKINTPEFRKQLEDATKAAAKINTPEFRKQLEDATEAAAKINTPEFRKQVEDATIVAAKLNTPEFRNHLGESLQGAADSAVFKRKLLSENSRPSPSAVEPAASPASQVPPEYNGEPLRKIGGSVSTPTIIFQMEPKYSEEARQAKFNGIVLVNLVVDQNGVPQNVHVLRGVGMGLDEKAVEAIQQYKFKPAIENGEPVPVSLNVEVNFRTFDGPKPQTLQSNSKPEVPTVAPTRPDGVTMPLIIYQVEPEYTKAARKAKKSGTVLLNLTVNNRGLPQNVHVIRSLDSGLDKKAVEAVKQYRFKPAMKDNQPIDVALNVEVNFQIF